MTQQWLVRINVEEFSSNIKRKKIFMILTLLKDKSGVFMIVDHSRDYPVVKGV